MCRKVSQKWRWNLEMPGFRGRRRIAKLNLRLHEISRTCCPYITSQYVNSCFATRFVVSAPAQVFASFVATHLSRKFPRLVFLYFSRKCSHKFSQLLFRDSLFAQMFATHCSHHFTHKFPRLIFPHCSRFTSCWNLTCPQTSSFLLVRPAHCAT